MKKQFLAFLMAGALTGIFSGCVSTVEGEMTAGVPFSKNTIVSRYQQNVTVEQLFNAAKEVLQFNGTLSSENRVSNTLEAKIDTRTVWVAVDEVEPDTVRVRVQAIRKNGLGDPDLAAEIDKQIALQLQRSMR